MKSWAHCKNILCVRLDNMGDVMMSEPAMRALKRTFHARITLLTSISGTAIASFLPTVDDVITWEAPWVKDRKISALEEFTSVIQAIRARRFDACVIFTVFSQNPLPAAMMVTLAGIPNRLAYCRENPYHLLTHWIPEKEPYDLLRHQVTRDLNLVHEIGAFDLDDTIHLVLRRNSESSLNTKLEAAGIDLLRPWIVLHPGVTESKRMAPERVWIEAGKEIISNFGFQLVITGTAHERVLANTIKDQIGKDAFTSAGDLTLEELIMLIRRCPLLITLNSGPAHLAAALNTKVIVLYALTNPQHPPWRAVGRILPFSVREELRSHNEILQFVHREFYSDHHDVTAGHVVRAVADILIDKKESLIPDLVLPAKSEPSMGAKSPEPPSTIVPPKE